MVARIFTKAYKETAKLGIKKRRSSSPILCVDCDMSPAKRNAISEFYIIPDLNMRTGAANWAIAI
jgi:hypothetical protein